MPWRYLWPFGRRVQENAAGNLCAAATGAIFKYTIKRQEMPEASRRFLRTNGVDFVVEFNRELPPRGSVCHRGAGFRHPSHTGRLNQKRLPCPGWLSTPYRPPWSSTIPRTMESPSPVPTAARLWALSTL